MQADAGQHAGEGGGVFRPPWAGLWLVLAAVLAYANSFSGAFMYDDFGSIPENPTIRHLWPPGEAWSPPRTGGLTVSGRPVLNFSFAVNYALGGVHPWGYHAVNLAIHAGAALLLFGLIRRTLTPNPVDPAGADRRGPQSAPSRIEHADRVAFVVALLWLLHPLQTEAVTYVVQRAESLMAFFYLLTLYAFVRGARSDRPAGWWALCVGSCLLGMGTKEVMVSAPLLVLVYDRTFCAGSFAGAWRRRRGLHLALAATWVPLVLLVLSLGGNRGGSIGVGLGLDWWGHWVTQFRSIGRYFRLTVWPRPLVFDYGAEPAPGLGEVWFQVLFVAALAGGTAWALRRRRAEGFLGLWFFAVLAPTSLMPGPIQMTVEHRMYLALAPLLLVVALAVHRVAGPRMVLAGLVAAVPFLYLTVTRNRDYRSEVAIWGDTVAKRPDNALARYNYGLALFQAGRTAEAVPEYEAALRLKAGKNDGSEHNNLATALVQLGRHREALPHYEAALRGPKPSAEVTYNLGLALLALGESEQALARFEEATRLKPEYSPAWNMQGATLATLGRVDDSVTRFEEAISRVGPIPDFLSNLGLSLMKLNRMPEAIARLEAAVKLRPDMAVFHSNLGIALARAGRWADATESFRRAVALNPDDPDVRLKLGTALLQSGRTEDALAAFTELVQRMPGNIQGHEALGQMLSRMPGREIEAAKHFAEARRLGGKP